MDDDGANNKGQRMRREALAGATVCHVPGK